MAPLIFKVWDVLRQKKVAVVLDDEDPSLYNNLIIKASEKLQIDGSHLVLEEDGTVIDEDEVVKLLNKEVFILLNKCEKWEVRNDGTESTSSLASTITLASSTGSPARSPLLEIPDSLNIQNSQINERISDNTWKNLELPLYRLSKNCIELCNKGCKSNKQIITEVVHAVVDCIREIKSDPPSIAFKYMANKLVEKYPQTFLDSDDDGCVIGNGSHSILSKLLDRNNYLNRPHKRKSLLNEIHTTPKQRRLLMTAKAGCSHWQPDKVVEIQQKTISEQITFLKSVVQNDIEMDSSVVQALNDTYPQQRLFLNNPETPTIDSIKNTWPILLKKNGIFWHYEKLMDHSIHSLNTVLRTRANKILSFGVKKKFLEDVTSNEEQVPIDCLRTISSFFKENFNVLVTTANKMEDLTIKTHAPCIAILLNSSDRGSPQTYYAFIEKELVEEFSNFMEAFEFIFASYYIFNMAYPKEVGCTLEFIQRYILKINPDQGTKNKRKTGGTIKIISLINALSQME